MTDLGRRTGGAAAVVAAFWLGFVCGGGGGLPGAAAIGGPSQQTDPAPADPTQADPAPADPTQADPAPADPTQADSAPEEAEQADPALEEAEQEVETEAPPGPEPPVVQDRPREFTARAGMVLYFVRQDAESAYEETMARVAEAFAVSESDEREEQAEGWRVYKAEEPLADGVRLYVSWVDPVVPGADYWVPGILSEAFPTEAQSLYETYAGAFADGQILLNLVPVAGP